MSGSENPSGAGRLTALATLSASAVLFLTALFGIATMDPNANAAGPAGGPAIRSISLEEQGEPAGERRDCPFRDRDRDRSRGEDAPDGVRS